MKMKRMEMRDVSIGEYQFKIRPFGAKDALYIFGDVASILLPILGSVAVASDDTDSMIQKVVQMTFNAAKAGLEVLKDA